ncbi:MAG: hypothetical protein WDM80_10190 [Limisphaerales bacterium]
MRKKIIIIIGCIAILLGGWAAYHYYKVRKEAHLISMAQQFLAKSEEQNALFCLRTVLRSNPNNVEAWRMQANIFTAQHSPFALAFRKRVVELNPDSMEDKLSMAQTALILGEYRSATNVLASVSMEGKKTAEFHNVAGAASEVGGQLAEAEAHYLEAMRLQPKVPAIQLNLAKVRLRGNNAANKAEARTILNRIADDPANAALCCIALRELIADANRSQQTQTAVALSKKLVLQTNSSFSDQLLRLNLLKQAGSAELKPALAEAQHVAAKNVINISALATWMAASTPLEGNLAWLRTLPPDIQTNYPTSVLIAQCLVFKPDWPGLQIWLTNSAPNWGDHEFLRHAFLARALKELNLNATSDTEWQKAVTLCQNQKTNLVELLKLIAQWNWESRGEDILWDIVDKYPGDPGANTALVEILFNSGRTRPLMMLFGQQLKWAPTDFTIKNNLTMCALLLDAQELKPNEMAQAAYELAPDNQSYISTYAFSLYLQKKYAEALQIIEKLSPQQLKKPSIAGYYGLILKANGNLTKAKPYFDLALKSNLLPEERKLFERARMGT